MKIESDIFDKIDQWAEQKQIYSLAALRILFGLFLIWKACQFGAEPESLPDVTGRVTFLAVFVIIYIVIVQLAAGILITIGLITRTAIICILPIILGAVIYSNSANFILNYTGEGWASGCLLLSLAFLIYGSGVFSCDFYFRKHPPRSYL
jgi:uncharacterized membrane protein YphA (DoxX/SURF4 family)